MQRSQIAAQLYTVRQHLKTPQDIAASLQKVREIGYEAVQVSGMGPIEEADLVAICADLGLTICATHEPSFTVLDDPQAVVDRLTKLNCRFTAYPYPRDIDFSDMTSVDTLVQKLDAAGKVLADAGQVLTYHNHAHELYRLPSGQTLLEYIYANTDPRHLQVELDLHWVQRGGGNPESWIRRYAGRQPLMHLKDFKVDPTGAPDFAEIGQGNLEWDRILPAATEAGVEWFIVEQDSTPGDPFASLAQSFAYLQAHCQ
ncbi:MAG: sugar phosphate isomerase/epimerase [Planctomycetota bacterium]|nr:MAG: sugar phosphate isomerase/epimerase [Planctomycetota bacterium]